MLFGSEDEPLTFEMEYVKVTARAGHEDMRVLEAKHFARIALKDAAFENFCRPHAVVYTDGTVETDIPAEHSTL